MVIICNYIVEQQLIYYAFCPKIARKHTSSIQMRISYLNYIKIKLFQYLLYTQKIYKPTNLLHSSSSDSHNSTKPSLLCFLAFFFFLSLCVCECVTMNTRGKKKLKMFEFYKRKLSHILVL